MALKKAGLVNLALFDHEGVTSMDNQYCVAHLLRVKKVDFAYVQ
jgi:hypothetical protein